jgi:hypothetical protein
VAVSFVGGEKPEYLENITDLPQVTDKDCQWLAPRCNWNIVESGFKQYTTTHLWGSLNGVA